MDDDAKKVALRMIPYGIYVMTAKDGDSIAAATVNWVTQTAFAPPLIAVGVKTDSGIYRAVTKSKSFRGSVEITSMVPKLFSRAIRLIVTAGIKKRYTKGIILNSDRISDWLKRKKVRVKKYPVITAKITRKI